MIIDPKAGGSGVFKHRSQQSDAALNAMHHSIFASSNYIPLYLHYITFTCLHRALLACAFAYISIVCVRASPMHICRELEKHRLPPGLRVQVSDLGFRVYELTLFGVRPLGFFAISTEQISSLNASSSCRCLPGAFRSLTKVCVAPLLLQGLL